MISSAAANASIASWTRPPSCEAYLRRLEREFGLRCTTTGNYFFTLHNDADNHECIVDSPFKFVDDVLCPATDNDGDGLWVFAFRDIDHLVARDFALLDKPGRCRDPFS